MPDEARAAAAYGSKLHPAIVEARVDARGAIMSLKYEEAADELTGYETALKDSIATLDPAPSVVEVRYAHEYNREVGAAAKKYGGGVLVREATAIARLWCASEFPGAPGRGLPYAWLKQFAYDVYGITIPAAQIYQNQSIHRDEAFEPPSVEWTANGTGRTTRSKWSETYGVTTHELAWLKAIVDAIHEGAGKEFWLRWTPQSLQIDNPEYYAVVLRILPTANHHPTGLESTEACYLSLFPEQSHVAYDINELEQGVPVVAHFSGITIPAGGVIEAVLSVDDEWNPDYNNENNIEIADDWEILWEEP
jgi:hypothetical protein